MLADLNGEGLSTDLSYFGLDDEMVVFSELQQSLIALNPAASQIVRRIQEGHAVHDLARVLASDFGIDAQTALRWYADTLQGLRNQTTVAATSLAAAREQSAGEEAVAKEADIPPYVPLGRCFEASYRLVGSCAKVRYAHRDQMRMVDAVIGHLKTQELAAPTLVIEIQGQLWGDRQLSSIIYRDGKAYGKVARLSQLGPVIKNMFWLDAVNNHDFILNLHAGVVGKGGRCILLPAAAGSGKSSLTTALVHAGLEYFSDEVALIRRSDFQVVPVPLAVCVKDSGWDVISRYYPGLEALPAHRRSDGKVVKYVPPSRAAVHTTTGSVSHIFFPRYSPDGGTNLELLARSSALANLMEHCVALRRKLDAHNVGQLVRWIAGLDCYRLTFDSLPKAVALVRQVAKL